MKDDFGYFGSGLEGYVQYNEAYKRNFDSASTPVGISDDDSNMKSEDDAEIEDNPDLDFDESNSSDNENI